MMRFCRAVVLGLLVLTGCGKEQRPAGGGRPGGGAAFVVETVVVQPQAFRDTVFAAGTLRANESVELPAQRAGVVKEVRFAEGQPVAAGEVLVVLDDAELQAQRRRAAAQLDLAQVAEQRSRQLLEAGTLVTAAEYDASRASLDVARAELELVEAQLAKTRVVAPFAGIAGLRRVSVGAYLTPGTPVASLQDVRTLKLDFALPERYLSHLRATREASFRVAGVPGELAATIYAIEPVVDETTRSLQVRARVGNEDQRLMPGAFAEVRVVLAEIPDAILIPPLALIPGLKEQRVYVHQAGKALPRPVQVGLRTAEQLQIVAGLQAGDEVIVSGILQLRPGLPVQTREAHR